MAKSSKCTRCTSIISSRTQELFRTFFWWLGVRIYRRPWLFMLIGAFITICCSLGGLLYKEEVRNFYLWVPQQSDIWSKFEHIKSEYGISPKMTLLLTMNDESQSILSPKNMDVAYKIFNEIHNIKYETYNYKNLCLRPYHTSPYCMSDLSNIFGVYFGSNPLLWQNNTNVYNTINAGRPNSTIIYAFAGGLKVNDMQFIIHANALLFVYELAGSINEHENDITYEYMGEFQDYWNIHKNDYSSVMNIEYGTYRSLDDEVSRVIFGDFHIMVLAVTVMTIFLMITLGSFSCIESRPWLAVSAVLVLICSMTIGFGIGFMTGTTFNVICILVAYILLGVGVDDMIILVDMYDRYRVEYECDEEARLCKTLSESGLSISLTSLCSSMAFTIGSTTDLPAISAFCKFAAWSFLANYLLQFLIFVPLMIYENQRIQKGNNFCCPCCFKHTTDNNNNNSDFSAVSLNDHDNKNREKTKTDSESEKQKVNKFKIEYFLMRMCIIPILSKRIGRWIIIFIFTAILYASIYVSFDINTDSDDTKLVPDDSFMLDYIDIYQQNFGNVLISDLNIILKNQDFSDFNVRQNTYDFINALTNDPNAIGNVHHWLNAFANFTIININSTNFTNLNDLKDSDIFYQYLQLFCNDVNYIEWHSEICSNDFTNHKTSTRFFLTVSKDIDRQKQWNEYLHYNSYCRIYFETNNCYIFEPEHTFAYLVSTIQKITIENMIFAAAGVFIMLCIFLDFRMAIFCLIMVIMIDIDLFGWMWLLNISLDVVSYTELVMAAGLTVDYVIHIVHSISDPEEPWREKKHNTYEEKIKSVMTEMGASVVKGAFTTFLGAVALVFSNSEAFRIFLYMFIGIILIALLHSILLVPAVLGELKCCYKGIPHSNTKAYAAIDSTSTMSIRNINRNKAMSKSFRIKRDNTLRNSIRDTELIHIVSNEAGFDTEGQDTDREIDNIINGQDTDDEIDDIINGQDTDEEIDNIINEE